MNGINPTGAATSPVLGFWMGEFVAAGRCVAPVSTVKGTGLSFGAYEGGPSVPTFERTRPSSAGTVAHLGVLGIDGVMGTDQVQATAVRIAVATGQGDPPRRTPSRC